jgi:hypothetical protein
MKFLIDKPYIHVLAQLIQLKGKGEMGENLKCRSIPLIAVFIGILMSLNLVPLANAQPYENAKFENIKIIHTYPDGRSDNFELVNGGTARVYDNDNLWIYLFCKNENLPTANLYTKTYVDNTLQRTYYIPYPILTGLMGIDAWSTTLAGPDNQRWTVELWWDNNGENILEDDVEFNVWVVKLFIGENNWLPASLNVEKGKTTPTPWSINFKNGGNDEMDDVSISVTDSDGLQIAPTSENFAIINAGETKSTSFSVTAPFTSTMGAHTVKFQIVYHDFMGISHAENMEASVNVTRLSTRIIIEPLSVKIGDSCTITAKLVDGNGDPIANQTISFSVENTPIGSDNTDSSGNAVISYTASAVGTYVVSAAFDGTENYAPSSETANLVVESGEAAAGESNALELGIIAVVAVVVIIALLILVKRKGVKAPPVGEGEGISPPPIPPPAPEGA